MSFTKLTVDRRGDVVIIRLNEPQTLNAVTERLLDELDRALDDAAATARAILLSSHGRAFCSGANLSDDTVGADANGVRDAGRLLETHVSGLIKRIKALPVPLVSAVRGAAAGVGASIALAADMIVAGESAYFLQAFSRLGLVPDGGAAWLLARSTGRVRAMELMLLGERVPAAQALDWGLINRVVPDAQLDAAALELADRLARGPTRAYGLIRALSWAACDGTIEDILQIERDAQRTAGRSRDAGEGIAAFVEKRAPNFTGR